MSRFYHASTDLEGLVATSQPIAWRVVWGRSLFRGIVTEVVEAYDAHEALLVARQMHPELAPPNMAVPQDPSIVVPPTEA